MAIYRGDDWMDTIAAIGLVCMFAFFSPIGVTFLAGLGSMVVGWAFEDTIRGVWRAVGVNLDKFTMFQIGVALGFAGSFMRSTLHASKK